MKRLTLVLLGGLFLGEHGVPALRGEESTPLKRGLPSVRQGVSFMQLMPTAPVTATVGVFSATLGLLYSLEKSSGQQAWQAYCAEAGQRGTKLQLQDYLRAPLPDAENFMAIPYLLESHLPGAKPLDLGFLYPGGKEPENDLSSGSFTESGLLRVEEWHRRFVAEKLIAAPTAKPGRDLVRMLDERIPALPQFRAALGRPGSRSPVSWPEDVSSPVHLFWRAASVAQGFRFSIAAWLAEGDQAAALRDWNCLFRLEESFAPEPGYGAGRARIFVTETLLATVWNGVALHQWSDENLLEIDRQLARLNYLAALRHVIDSQRVFSNQYWLKQARRSALERHDAYGRMLVSPLTAAGFWSFVLHPDGWAHRAMLLENRYADHLLALYAPVTGQERTFIAPHETIDEWVEHYRSSEPRAFFYGPLFHWDYSHLIEYTHLMAQAQLQMARLACALERSYLQKKAYPETLAELVPAFLPAVLLDPCDGQPMRYRRLGEGQHGGYLLWSVAANRREENGQGDSAWLTSPDWVWKVAGQ